MFPDLQGFMEDRWTVHRTATTFRRIVPLIVNQKNVYRGGAKKFTKKPGREEFVKFSRKKIL
jgi:hypothetical protein